MTSDVLSTRTLGESVADALRERVLSGEFADEARLSDVDVAQMFDVSRATGRAALRELSYEGLVVSRPHRGFFVKGVSPSDTIDLLVMRASLEGRAAAHAVSRLSREDFSRLEGIVAKFAGGDYQRDIGKIREIDVLFHGLIAERSEKPILIQLWSSLNSRLFLMEYVCRNILQLNPESSAARHEDYIKVLRQGDPVRAREAAEAHYFYYIDLLTGGSNKTDATPFCEQCRLEVERYTGLGLLPFGRRADGS